MLGLWHVQVFHVIAVLQGSLSQQMTDMLALMYGAFFFCFAHLESVLIVQIFGIAERNKLRNI